MSKNCNSRLIFFMAIILVLFVFVSACSNNGNNSTEEVKPTPAEEADKTANSDKPEAPEARELLVDKEVELDILMAEHASFPVKTYTDSPFLQHITELTGIKANLLPIPEAGDAYKQKLNIMLNTNDLPDIIWSSVDDANINSLAEKGMFLSYDDYMEHTPNLKAAIELFPDIRKNIAGADGKLYVMPRLMFDNMTELFIIRQDIMEKEQLQYPKNYDELYILLKTLKEKYPDHTVFINRNGSEHLVNRLAYNFGSGYENSTHGFYLNREEKTYQYGPLDPEFKEMVIWLKKLYDDGILDKEYALLTTKQWEEAFASEKALFTIDYIARIEQNNNNYIGQNSKARVVAMAPPVGPTGNSGFYGRSGVLPNSGISVPKDTKDPVAAFKFIDWIYGEEGKKVARYGIENETFEVNSDNTVSFTAQMKSDANPNGKELVKDYGWIYYLNKFEFPIGHLKPNAAEPVKEDNLYMFSRKVMEDAKAVIEPDPSLSYSEEQLKIKKSKGTALQDYFKQNIDKFIMGARPIGEWEQFVTELNDRGVSELTAMLNEAYKSYLDK